MIKIEFNGKTEEIAERMTLRDFLNEKKLVNPNLILELNDEIIADSAVIGALVLNDGDRLNAFSLVGGG